MTESQDRHLSLKALSRIHDLPPLRSEQPKPNTTPSGRIGGKGARPGQGRRSGGVLSLLFHGDVWRW
jgi:hypothetical protein